MAIDIYKLHTIQRLSAHENEERKRAELRNVFYAQDNYSIKYILRNDLSNFMDNYDISKLRLVTLDEFVKSFISKIALVHKSPVIFKFDKEIPEEQTTRIRDLFNEVNLQNVLYDTEMRMKLHNTVLAGVRYFQKLDKLFIENTYDAATTQIIGYEGFENEERYVIRERKNRNHKTEYVVWDREKNFNYIVTDYPFFDEKTGDIGNKKFYDDGSLFDEGKSYYPFVKYQAFDQGVGFWGNGFDSIVELTRTINILLTVLADDTISETLRILLLNFIPVGIDGKPGQFKIGLRNPVIAQLPPGERAEANVVTAELYTDDILKYVDKLVDQLTSMYGIDNVLSKEIKADISGVAARLRNEHLMRTWQQDINTIRKYDKQLVKKIVEVNNFHRPKNKIDEETLDGLILDYQVPEVVVNEMEDYTLERLKWQDGTSNPVLWVMRRNPELTKDEAEQQIRDNLDTTNTLLGIGQIPEVSGSFFNEDIGA